MKTTVSGLCSRFKKGEERYDLLKTHAETKLGEANTRLDEVKRSRACQAEYSAEEVGDGSGFFRKGGGAEKP